MKLSDAYGYYAARSTKASDVARQLAFAGLAVVWIFKTGDNGLYSVPHGLVWPTVLMIGTLASDLLQYAVASLLWGTFHRLKERELLKEDRATANDKEFEASPWINWPGLAFFWVKLFLVSAAYILLIGFLVTAIKY